MSINLNNAAIRMMTIITGIGTYRYFFTGELLLGITYFILFIIACIIDTAPTTKEGKRT